MIGQTAHGGHMGRVLIELEGCNSQSKRECTTGNLLAGDESQQQ